MAASEPAAAALPPRIEIASAGPRIALIDAARGVAIVAMVVYHFTWDLWLNGLIALNPTVSPAWRWSARLIAGTFLALVGVSLVLANRKGLRWEPFLRRLAFVAGAAALLSVATWFLAYQGFLPGFVFFGILHAIALFSVLALPFLRAPIVVVVLAAAASFAAPAFLTHPFFDPPLWAWLGLSPSPPAAVDYVPLFPWFGATLTGIAVARLALSWRPDAVWASWRADDPVSRALVTAGRWSLVIYLVHQPLLFSATALGSLLLQPRTLEDRVAVEIAACQTTCEQTGRTSATLCAAYCGCVFGELQIAGLLERVLDQEILPEEEQRWIEITRQCQPIPPPPLEPAPPAPP